MGMKEMKDAYVAKMEAQLNEWSAKLKELKAKADAGFLLAHWCEKPACEAQLKQESQITTRNRPFSLKQEPGKCVVCGSDSPGRIVFAKSY